MDSIAVVLIGLGLFLVYEAVKNPAPTPIQKLLALTQGQSTGGSGTPAYTPNPTPASGIPHGAAITN